MTDPNIVVPVEPTGPVSPDETQATTSPVSPVETQTPPAVDADKLKAEYEGKLAQYENDLRNMKSSLQQNESKLKREFEQRQKEYEREVEKYRLASMDDDERKIYEAELAKIHAQELEEEKAKIERESSDQAASLQAYHYFISQGVPANELKIDEGYDALFQSGWGWIINDYNRLRSAPPPATTAQSLKEPPKAPPVVTTTAATPSGKTSWEELRKKYNTDDEGIYRLVETGQLSKEVIPPTPG